MRFQESSSHIQKEKNGPERIVFLTNDQPEEDKSIAGDRAEYPEGEQTIAHIGMLSPRYLHEKETEAAKQEGRNGSGWKMKNENAGDK